MLERFADELGQEVDYRQVGYLFMLTQEADLGVFRRNVALQHRLGVNHVGDGNNGKVQSPAFSGFRVDLAGPGGAHAATQHVDAHDEVTIGV